MIPTYDEFKTAVIQVMGDGEVRKLSDLREIVAGPYYFDFSEEERAVTVSSGSVQLYKSRIDWAVTYVFQAGLLKRIKRGYYQITERGITALKSGANIDDEYLSQFEEFRDFLGRTGTKKSQEATVVEYEKIEEDLTPEESIDQSIKLMHKELSSELIEEILAKDAFFFERLVVQLLYKMGYGSHVDRAKVTKKSGDDGIDGIISSDRLGLDTIYVQAKRYATDNIIGNNQIRDFMGALLQKGATKGVFITTSDFSESAKRAVRENRHQVIALINGQQLTSLMIEYNLGVSIEREIYIKRLDSDFFDENF